MMISAEGAQRISLLYQVARIHGSLVTLADLVHLMPERMSEGDLADAIQSHPALSSKFTLESGYVIEKGVNLDPQQAFVAERQSRARASTNLWHAARFAPLVASSQFQMVGVSGSTSYRSASRSRDLDLFCVSPSGTMWISLTKALLLSRVFSLMNREGPPICLSCVMDESYARKTFSADQGALFARDALETITLVGESEYESLLGSASWISSIYPTAFAKRSASANNSNSGQRSSPWKRAFNSFLFFLTGTYIGAKSSALNRRLARKRESDSAFTLRKGVDHLIYESRRYAKLRSHYSAVLPSGADSEVAKSGTAH
jgi:hypothetical protein